MHKIIFFLVALFLSLHLHSQTQSASPVRYNARANNEQCNYMRGKFYLLRPSGEKITDTRYDYIDFNKEGSIIFNKEGSIILQDRRILKAVLNGEKVYIDSLGNTIVKDVFSDFDDLSYQGIDAVIVRKGRKYGVMSADFKKQILPLEYSFIKLLNNNRFRVTKDRTLGITDLNGRIIIPTGIYNSMESDNSFNDLYLMIKGDNKYLVNKQGKEVATFGDKNIWIHPLSEGINIIQYYGSQTGIIDSSGKWIYPMGEYAFRRKTGGSLHSIGKNRKYGLINSKAKLILPIEYDDIDVLSFGKGAILKTKKNDIDDSVSYEDMYTYQYADSLGNIKINSQKKIVEHHDELYAYISDGGYAIYDMNGNLKSSHPRASLPASKWETFRDEKTNKRGFKDWWGEVKIPAQFEELPSRSFGYLSPYTRIAKYADWKRNCDYGKCKYGVIDTLGNIVISPKYDAVEIIEDLNRFIVKREDEIYFLDDKERGISNRMNYIERVNYRTTTDIIFEKGNKYGIYDVYGNALTPFEYDKYESAGNMLKKNEDERYYPNILFLWKNNKVGIWDIKERKESVPFIYEDAGLFYSGNLMGYKDKGKWGIINYKTGEIVIPAVYDDIQYTSIGLRVLKDSLWGIIDIKTGENIIPIEYENIYLMKGGLIQVRKNSLWGIIDLQGREILPCKYDLIENPQKDVLVVGEDVWCYQNDPAPKAINNEQTYQSSNTNSDSKNQKLRIIHREGVELFDEE